MPIEIRPSDVMSEAARAFGQWGATAHDIMLSEHEKERVREENSGLITIDQMFRQSEENRPQQDFEVPPPGDETGGQELVGVTSVKRPLGKAPLSAVELDFQNQVNALEQHILSTVHNKTARQNLLNHLKAGAVAYRSRMWQQWREARDDGMVADITTGVDTVMKNNSLYPLPEQKLAAVVALALPAKNCGALTETAYNKLLVDVKEQAKQTYAYNGATNAMVNGYIPEAVTLEQATKVKELNTKLAAVEAEIVAKHGFITLENQNSDTAAIAGRLAFLYAEQGKLKDAVAAAKEDAGMKDYGEVAAEKWMEEKSDLAPEDKLAILNKVRTEVNYRNEAFDSKASMELEKREFVVRDDPLGIWMLLAELDTYEFKTDGKRVYWMDRLMRRYNDLTRVGGGDIDNQDNPEYMAEWFAIDRSLQTGKGLAITPKFAPPGLRSLAAGKVVTKDDAASWMIAARGGGRVKATFADSTIKAIRSDRPGGWSHAEAQIIDMGQPHGKIPPVWTQDQVMDTLLWANQMAAEGTVPEDKIMASVASKIANVTIGKITTGSADLVGGLFTGANVQDDAEKLLAIIHDGKLNGWNLWSDEKKADVWNALDQLRNVLTERVTARLGAPTDVVPQTNGELWFLYGSPEEVAKGIATTIRFDVAGTGKRPVMQVRDALGKWTPVPEQRTIAEVQADLAKKAKIEASHLKEIEQGEQRVAKVQEEIAASKKLGATDAELGMLYGQLEDAEGILRDAKQRYGK